ALSAGQCRRSVDTPPDDGGPEVPACVHTIARTGTVRLDRHFGTQPLNLACRALDGRMARLALGLLANRPSRGDRGPALGVGAASRADSSRSLSPGELAGNDVWRGGPRVDCGGP